MDIFANDKQYIAGTYARTPVAFTRGEGALLFDGNGKPYIDLGAGIAVNTFGHNDDGWVSAVTDQLRRIAHTSNLYFSSPQVLLAKTLCERTGMRKVFFSNSGAEANECMIKTARKYAADRFGENTRSGIITLKGSFHGRTIATLAATGQDAMHHDFGPFPDGFFYTEPNDIADLEATLQAHGGKCCAIMFEPVQGEGGVRQLAREYTAKLAALAEQYDLLLLADEVQTGNGRTGTLFAFEQYGLSPDIFSTAKGLAGGLPFGATLFGAKTADVLQPGSHGSTFGGNPVCAAGALHVLSRLDDDFLADVRKKSEHTRRRLTAMQGVLDVTGLGLMIGIETKKPAKEVIAEALAHGVVVLSAKNRVRLLPPLNIPMDLLDQALDVLETTFS